MDKVLVAEIEFNRNASADELRRLGEALEACRQAQGWIAAIGGLEELLRGECPMMFSKAVFNPTTGKTTPLCYDPILVWGRTNYPTQKPINPIEILRAAIPPSLGRVSHPSPDGGL